MRVIVASHPSAFEHDAGPGHPERPDRLSAVLRGVSSSGLEVVQVESPEIARDDLTLTHRPAYIEMIEAVCSAGGGALDPDTVVSQRSMRAALTAAGGVLRLVDELSGASGAVGFAATRPPGHHALADRAMGFCVFNNVATAAAVLRSRGERVAVVDWDVHHGNGTQALLGDDPEALYVSIHQSPFYPHTGHLDDIDAGGAKGTNVNIPMPAGTAGDVYTLAWERLVIGVVDQFGPDWVLVSAGYDAHRDDPLGGLELVSADYGRLAAELAKAHPPSRTVVALEGGYDLRALEKGTAATLQGLAGAPPPPDPTAVSPDLAHIALSEAAEVVSRHWDV